MMVSYACGSMLRAAIGFALVAVASVTSAAQCEPADLGCQIFNGQHPLPAHLRDDTSSLPAFTTRCVNCHAQTPPAADFAPPLTGAYLVDPTRRRGGPPTRYNPVSLCRALREGIDPADIVLRKAMPLFQISDDQCRALWLYVTSR